EDDPHQVVGTGFVIMILHGGSDFIVGLGHNLLNLNALLVVAPGLEWIKVCHNGKEDCSSQIQGA
ncbi:MAG TPA: hypothetical protein VNN16_02850, partial [Candidatus Sulfotelmatobacter sp.]|nr:hypothetical protein [Candidatus Sulfotelmatobacter sp.]